MGIQSKIQAKLSRAFNNKLSDAVSELVGTYKGSGTHDPVEGTTAGATVTYTGRGVVYDVDLSRIDGLNFLTGDAQAVILANEVTEAPGVGHFITARGAKYLVMSAGMDPALATYTLHLRRV